MGNYYKLPIRFDSIFDEKGGDLAVCSEIESIDQYIELLLTTCPGELKFDRNFGCRIWDMDFERVVERKKWEEDFKKCIIDVISQYEKRLKDVEVNVNIQDVAKEDRVLQTTAIKKKVAVRINAVTVSDGQRCGFTYKLYLGPLSTT